MRNIVIGNTGGVEPVSLVALVVSLLTLAFTVYWNFRSERQSYSDSYWFRTVVGPKCVEPIIAFRDCWSAKFAAVEGCISIDEYRAIVGEFQVDKAKLEDSLWISRIFGPKIFKECSSLLEQLEDSLADKLARLIVADAGKGRVAADLANQLMNCSVGMLSSIAKTHSGGLKVQNSVDQA
ncbi:TPA: hypothetical protein UM358_001041 [Stenotrophomonas maltophilia]|uniref:hypothetical protein n=1 Tax=Stenotrophomonas maltophilia TaxID=40324 RepID=UPI001658A917|nr:hypothetical protein [Stenotrophomonas maltophilia]MBC9117419.1 hypothetical protein [Stenotrophomonas maltophilia]HEL3007235.1 hypothetical protein [Stenotrophomonas maltophilia]HEL4204587.1 hypothetical protein [Stenotrophomonas maltophilia]